jgi:large subunit ribosomal protein L19
MQSVAQKIEAKYKKHAVVDVKTGDTVRVSQKIREGNKERVQMFEGLVIRTGRAGSLTSSITVRRIASGVGVEKTYLLHSPLIVKIEVTKRTKVRRNYISYMRTLKGKSARLSGVDFDKSSVNTLAEAPIEEETETTPATEAEAPAEEATVEDSKE